MLTDDFNRDHPHHRGIFWAWEVVTVNDKTDDMWTVKGFKHKFVRWHARETNGPLADATPAPLDAYGRSGLGAGGALLVDEGEYVAPEYRLVSDDGDHSINGDCGYPLQRG